MEKRDKKYGTAYAFMDLDASIKQVREELPKARNSAQTPSQLEISVREVKDLIADRNVDRELIECIQDTGVTPVGHPNMPAKKIADLRDVIEAKYQNADNGRAAEQLTDISNYLYDAFGNNKPFYAELTAKAPNGKYMAWSND